MVLFILTEKIMFVFWSTSTRLQRIRFAKKTIIANIMTSILKTNTEPKVLKPSLSYIYIQLPGDIELNN